MGKPLKIASGGTYAQPNPFTNSGQIVGSTYTVPDNYAPGGFLTVTAGYAIKTIPYVSGSVIPAPFETIFNSGGITASYGTGILLLEGGQVTNEVSGIILGVHVAIAATYSETPSDNVLNLGTIAKEAADPFNEYAVDLYAATVVNGATDNATAIIEGSRAVRLISGGSVTNFAQIVGQQHGGVDLAGFGEVANYGTVRGIDAAVSIGNGGRLVNAAPETGSTALIYGQDYGVDAIAPGTVVTTVINSGSIDGGREGVRIEGAGDVNNTYGLLGPSVGTISGDGDGVVVYGLATVSNTGLIEGPNLAVNLSDGGSTLLNAGMITGAVGVGNGGVDHVTNFLDGTIQALGTYSSDFALRLSGSAVNEGTIRGGGGITDSWYGGATVTIAPTVTNTGTILALYTGIAINGPSDTYGVTGYIGNLATFDIITTEFVVGTIIGSNYGISVNDIDATVRNSGIVKALGFYRGRYGSGVYLGFSDGEFVNDDGAFTGPVVPFADYLQGTLAPQPTTGAPDGYVFGAVYGVRMRDGGASIVNLGTIKGRAGIDTYGGTLGATIYNDGTVIGTSGNAIVFGKGANDLYLGQASVIDGYVRGGNSTRLILGNGRRATAAGTLDGIGASISGITAFSVDAYAQWVLAGTNFFDQAGFGATIEGTIDGTLAIGSGANFGLAGTIRGGITVDAGGTLEAAFASTLSSTATAVLLLGDGTVVGVGGLVEAGSGAGIDATGDGTIVLRSGTQPSTITGETFGISAGSGTRIVNAGTIEGTRGAGIAIANGLVVNGYVTLFADATTASVIGPLGVRADGGTFVNDATIMGTAGAGLTVAGGGTLLDGLLGGTAAHVLGTSYGVVFDGNGTYGDVTVVNHGVLSAANGPGLYLHQNAGYVTNAVGGTIGGATGLRAVDAGHAGLLRIVNSGSIAGTLGLYGAGGGGDLILDEKGTVVGSGGTAVAFGAGDNALVAYPGAVFEGSIVAGAADRLELVSGAGTGTLGPIGVSVLGFGTIDVDPFASWQFDGYSSIAPGVALTNDGFITVGANYGLTIAAALTADAGHLGAVTVGAGAVADFTGSVGANQIVSFLANSGEVSIAHYSQFLGTVENFTVGDTIHLDGVTANNGNIVGGVLIAKYNTEVVATLDVAGNFTPFTKHFTLAGDGTDITLQTVACFAGGTRIATAAGEVAVERLRPGMWAATASGRMARIGWIGRVAVDLMAHPEAAPIRVRAGALGPGVPRRDLLLSPDHAVLMAGRLVPVRLLRNGATIVTQAGRSRVTYYHVELDRHDALLAEGAAAESFLDAGNRGQFRRGRGRALRYQPEACLVLSDEANDLHARLVVRAEALGWRRTRDPALVVVAGRRRIPARRISDRAWDLELPPDTETATVRSRIVVPADLGDARDRRALGVPLSRIRLHGATAPPALCTGWHEAEGDAGEAWRWTDGAATLALPPCPAPLRMELIGPPGWQDYWAVPA
jgi:hypothetical protein